MILAYHVIMTAYGFWLPNDPRGSWSDFVGAWELIRFGKATTVRTRRSLAHEVHDRQLRDAAKAHLKYPPVSWTGEQARGIAIGFACWLNEKCICVHACAILPEHIHLVVQRPTSGTKIEQVINAIKGAATRRLISEAIHPFRDIVLKSGRHPKMFARGCWKVFLDSEADVSRAVRYVDENPIREGKARQRWNFVRPLK